MAKKAVTYRALQALRIVGEVYPVVEGYLFGSQVSGNADEDSDIDIAVFVDVDRRLNLDEKVEVMTLVQRQLGDDIEIHLFSVSDLVQNDSASFAGFIAKYGVPLHYGRCCRSGDSPKEL